MIFQTIETERLTLREFKETDFQSIHNYASNSEVTMYLPFGPNSETDTKLFLKKVIQCQFEDQRQNYEIAVVLKESNTLIGACRIYITSISNKEGSIGYCYDKQYWGNGYASEVAKAVINFGFEKLKLHRIFATCDPKNISSAMVMKKVGMKKEGHLREHKFVKGKWRDSLIYSILDYEQVAGL